MGQKINEVYETEFVRRSAILSEGVGIYTDVRYMRLFAYVYAKWLYREGMKIVLMGILAWQGEYEWRC